jgi:hypothetical protein
MSSSASSWREERLHVDLPGDPTVDQLRHLLAAG